MAELVDALDSKSSSFGVGVRFPPGVLKGFQPHLTLSNGAVFLKVANKCGKQWQTFFNSGEIMIKGKESILSVKF